MPATEARHIDLAAFAREVNAAAARVRGPGRFGERKVFISAIWRAVRTLPICAGMDLQTFKRTLVRANREDLVQLHRADLVPVMPIEEVTESEIQHLNATFHFVQDRT